MVLRNVSFYNQLLFLRDSVSNRTTHSNVQVRPISLVVTSSPSNKSVPESPTQTPEPPPPTSKPPTPTPDLHIGDETCQPVQNQQQPVTATAQPPARQKLQFPQATVIPKKKKKVELDPVEEYLIKSIEKGWMKISYHLQKKKMQTSNFVKVLPIHYEDLESNQRRKTNWQK